MNTNTQTNTNNNYSLLEPFFNELFGCSMDEDKAPHKHHSLMRTDIVDSGENYTFLMNLPSVNKEDIKISLEEGYLTINASTKTETEDKDEKKHFLRKERFEGTYSRSFYVGDIDEKNIKAKLENGVLTLIVPKEKEVTPEKKYITIE